MGTLLGTCSWEPCLGTTCWEPLLGSLFLGTSWGPYLGTCSWEPCLETLLGNLFLGTLLGSLFLGTRFPTLRGADLAGLRASLGKGNPSWEPGSQPCAVRIWLLRPAPEPLLWLKTPSLRCWVKMHLRGGDERQGLVGTETGEWRAWHGRDCGWGLVEASFGRLRSRNGEAWFGCTRGVSLERRKE